MPKSIPGPCSLLSSRAKKQLLLLCYGMMSFVLFFLIRNFEVSQDYQNYSDWYDLAITKNENLNLFALKDPAFYFLANLSHSLGGDVSWVILCFVSVSVLAKTLMLAKFEVIIICTFILLYMSKLFFVLEMTQFRASAAVAITTLAFFLYADKRYIFSFFLFCIALTTHLSTILILCCIPLFWLAKRLKYQKSTVLILCVFIFIFILLPMNFAMLSHIPVVGSRILPYINTEYQTVPLSLVNTFLGIKLIFIFTYSCWFLVKKGSGFRNANLFYLHFFFFVACLSSIFFIAFRQNDTIALRVSEFFLIFDLLFFTFFAKIFSKDSKVIYRFFVLVLCCVFLFSSMKLLTT